MPVASRFMSKRALALLAYSSGVLNVCALSLCLSGHRSEAHIIGGAEACIDMIYFRISRACCAMQLSACWPLLNLYASITVAEVAASGNACMRSPEN